MKYKYNNNILRYFRNKIDEIINFKIIIIRLYFCFKLFNRLRVEKPDFMDRIKIIDGNMEDSTMGLSSTDRDWLIENVNFVFHCAATIKFNEPLAIATKINIQGTKNLLTLATDMKNLKVFAHSANYIIIYTVVLFPQYISFLFMEIIFFLIYVYCFIR